MSISDVNGRGATESMISEVFPLFARVICFHWVSKVGEELNQIRYGELGKRFVYVQVRKKVGFSARWVVCVVTFKSPNKMLVVYTVTLLGH